MPCVTSGRESRSSRNALLVVPPSTTTAVWRIARASRARASSRVRPHEMTFAIMESYCGGMTSPVATPVSTRMPGPAGSTRWRMAPGAGAKPCSGSSAVRRASMAWPDEGGVTGSTPPSEPSTSPSAPPMATCSWSLTMSTPVTASVTGCSTCSRVLTSMNDRTSRAGS